MTRAVRRIAMFVVATFAAPLAAQAPAQPPPVWSPPLCASIESVYNEIWDPAADSVTHIYGKMSVAGTPGFWVYPAAWVSITEPTSVEEKAVYDQLIAKFPFLVKQPPSVFNTLGGAYPALGGPALEIPDLIVQPLIQMAIGTATAIAAPGDVRRSWQPICAPPGPVITGAPTPATQSQTRTWDCKAPVWHDATPVENNFQKWWASVADSDPDPDLGSSVIDFDVLAQKVMVQQAALIHPAEGESLNTFFNTGPSIPLPDIDSWYGCSKTFGLVLEIQFLGLVSTSPSHITSSNEIQTNGLTGLEDDPDAPPRVAWSDKLAVTFYLPRPPMTSDALSVNPVGSLTLAGGNLGLKLRAAVTPLSIEMHDGAGTLHVGSLHWVGVGKWGLTLPPGFASGTATINSLTSPFETLLGAGQPWSTFTVQAGHLP